MTVLFFIFLDQICPKWTKLDQTWSKWISHKSKKVSLKSFHIYKKDKNVCLILDFFGFYLSKMDQTWSNLINWISHKSKNVTIKSCHVYKKNNNGCFILAFFGLDLSKLELDQTFSNFFKLDQTWSNLIKLDQTWSNVDFSSIKKCHYKKL